MLRTSSLIAFPMAAPLIGILSGIWDSEWTEQLDSVPSLT